MTDIQATGNKKFPFYSRKYGMFFQTWEKYKNYDAVQKRKWLIEKHGQYNGKAYLPKKYRKGYTAW